jgi:hypothetical protein
MKAANNKKVPWPQIKKYLSIHRNAIEKYMDLKKNYEIDIEGIEKNMPKSFL